MYSFGMAKWIITGASGSVATECIKLLSEKKIKIDAYSRSELKIKNELIKFTKIVSYDEIDFDLNDCECILMAQGFFDYKSIKEIQNNAIDNLIEANFVSQIKAIAAVLKKVNHHNRINIGILGSTSAYQAGYGTSIYGACKAGILGFVRALNNEYIDSDIRFCLISFGTLLNEMGAKVPNQDPDTLLEVKEIAEEIIAKMLMKGNSWQSEIIMSRRHIKTLN